MLAEAFNTLSNLPGIILSLIGFINSVHMKFERRFCILHFYSMVVGVGSMLLHCTLIVK
jgi:dihydroceramidase